MAAGLGTRLRPFTEKKPKPFLPVLGVPVVQFAIDSLKEAGIQKAVINIHHLAEKAKQEIAALDWGGIDCTVSDESKLLLGSGGGVRKALPILGKRPFLLFNADVICGVDLQALIQQHFYLRKKHQVRLSLAVCKKPTVSAGKYREIIFHKSSPHLIAGLGGPNSGVPFYMGVAVIEPEAVALLESETPADFVSQILLPAIKEKKAGAFFSDEPWYDIGSPLLWLQAHWGVLDAWQKGKLPQVWQNRLNCAELAPSKQSANWILPCYWRGNSDPPDHLGPNAVMYGAANSSSRFSHGIGLDGFWVNVDETEGCLGLSG